MEHVQIASIDAFQYILCYGSTFDNRPYQFGRKDISIHPMLRFNFGPNRGLCRRRSISIHPMLRFNVQFSFLK